jgi:hypothetical protein
MHHFPHMHVMQQRMAQQQMMSQMQNSGDRAKEIEALKQSGILNLLSAPEGREKLSSLVERINIAKISSEEELRSWSNDQKESFFEGFRNQDLIAVLESKMSSENPLEKITSFLEMPDSSLSEAVKFQLIVGADSKLLKQIREPEQETDVSSLLNLVYTTVSSLSSANLRMMSGTQGHSHAHNHGSACQVHGQNSNQPDISQGKSVQMDR